MPSGFLDRLIARLDKLDPESLHTQFMHQVRERGVLEAVFQAIQEGLLLIDGEGRLTYANSAAERLLGFDAKRMRGRPVMRYLKVLDWGRLLQSSADDWAQVANREVEVTYPEHRVLNFYAVPVAASADESQALLVILRDVTREREQDADQIANERIQAVQLLAAGVAHEIGNPLNALTIHLQLIERELRKNKSREGENLRQMLHVARDEVGRLDVIISQFLRAVRPARPHLSPGQPLEIIKDTLRLMRKDIENRRVQVAIEHPDFIPKVRLDRQQIRQVFFNLIKNAVDAMPGGGCLRIVLEVGDANLAIAFHDTGSGIPAEELGRIFEPYHTTKADGSGLGLMIVQRIVREHGGQIEIASKPDKGSCFRIMLPLPERRVRLLRRRNPESVGEGLPEGGKI